MMLHIPKPTGHFGVSKIIFPLVDKKRKETHGGNGHRELMIALYYPTDAAHSSPYAAEIMPLMKENLAASMGVPLEQLAYLDNYKEHSRINEPLTTARATFPVLFFSPGLGDPVDLYASLLEEMASHGYVVMAINHTYAVNPTVFPDGRIIRMDPKLANFLPVNHHPFEQLLDAEQEIWINDAHCVIDAITNIKPGDPYSFLRNKLDYGAMGMFGHSFGGSLALHMARERTDIKACADLDGLMFGPASKRSNPFSAPSMFVVAGKQVTDQELKTHNMTRDDYDRLVQSRLAWSMYEKLENDSFYITILDAQHNSFSDSNLLVSPLKTDGYEPVQIINTVRTCLVEFFDDYVRNERLNMEVLGSLPNVVIENNRE